MVDFYWLIKWTSDITSFLKGLVLFWPFNAIKIIKSIRCHQNCLTPLLWNLQKVNIYLKNCQQCPTILMVLRRKYNFPSSGDTQSPQLLHWILNQPENLVLKKEKVMKSRSGWCTLDKHTYVHIENMFVCVVCVSTKKKIKKKKSVH